jgi:hypothetical protein
MSETPQYSPSNYSYRELAHLLECVEAGIRRTLGDLTSDGAPPKEILHSPYLSRMESEVSQDTVRTYLEMQQAWADDIRRRLERFRWIETSMPKPPFMTSSEDQENKENGKPKEEPRRRRRRAKDAAKPPTDGGDGAS